MEGKKRTNGRTALGDKADRLLEKLVKETDFERSDGYHALRHSFISILVALGKTWDQFAAFVGHSLIREYQMEQRYEFKFVRLGEGWLAARRDARQEYQRVIEEHAREGWRLVQVFAPGTGVYGATKYFELILERPC